MGPNHYSYADNNFLPVINYYRLKIVERSAEISYSVIIKTESQLQSDLFRIVPNPVADDEFSLLYSSPVEGIVTISINDVIGRQVHTIKERVNKGQNVIYLKGIPGWQPGIYFVSVNNNGEMKQGKLLKTR
jgi:hypothetical protein